MKSLTVYVGIFKDGKCEEHISGNFTIFPEHIKAMDNFVGLLDSMCPDKHFYIAWDYVIKQPRPEPTFPPSYREG